MTIPFLSGCHSQRLLGNRQISRMLFVTTENCVNTMMLSHSLSITNAELPRDDWDSNIQWATVNRNLVTFLFRPMPIFAVCWPLGNSPGFVSYVTLTCWDKLFSSHCCSSIWTQLLWDWKCAWLDFDSADAYTKRHSKVCCGWCSIGLSLSWLDSWKYQPLQINRQFSPAILTVG